MVVCVGVAVCQAVRQTWLGDYVEELARWAMGDPGSVPLFITQCLAFERLPVVSQSVNQQMHAACMGERVHVSDGAWVA